MNGAQLTEAGQQLAGRAVNAVRSHLGLRLYVFLVLAPTLLGAIYYALFASDVFVAEARFAVRGSQETPIAGLFDSVFSAEGTPTSDEDALIVRDYILSRDMLEELDRRLSLKQHYSSSDVDLISRLDDDASLEEMLEFYHEMLGVEIESTSNITTLNVRAFSPQMAHEIATTIIELSEGLVNRLSDRIVEDTLEFARNEVSQAEARVRKANDALTQFRNATSSIDPGQETAAVIGIVTGLETQLAAARAELDHARSYMRGDSPQVQNLAEKVAAIDKQVQDERRRLASQGGEGVNYTQLIDRYAPLLLEQKLSEQVYASALTSLELARTEAQRKQRYLLSFVQPRVPDEATEPDRLRKVILMFIVLTLAYGIGGLVWAAVKDHMRM